MAKIKPFDLGQVIVYPNAQRFLAYAVERNRGLGWYLRKHRAGDWGGYTDRGSKYNTANMNDDWVKGGGLGALGVRSKYNMRVVSKVYPFRGPMVLHVKTSKAYGGARTLVFVDRLDKRVRYGG